MEQELKKIKLPSTVTVKKFSELLGLAPAKVITELFKNKILATINEEIDFETASIIAQDLGFETEEDLETSEGETLSIEKLVEICKKEKESGKNLRKRPPVVTILGHVDHGKTSLLDTIRKTSVAAKEAGGITQHIRAYQVKKKGELITFVDTPGHEAFSAMRERGVSIADIAVLVVAADDGVRPQTKEVITYLKEKKIPTVVAINKVDKPEANVQRVKQELAENDILVEQWGGDKVCVEVSAKTSLGIDDLLESILLVAEVEDFRADEKREALGVVLEAHLDPNKGPVATILVKTGTLKVGQDVITGTVYGRIRKIEDHTGKAITAAGPSSPVTIMGLSTTPNTNDILQVALGKSAARSRSKELAGFNKEKNVKSISNVEDQNIKKLNLIIKSDVQGSIEAIEQILGTVNCEEAAFEYVGVGVGNITESDVKLAASTGAVILGFNVETTSVAKRLAESNAVQIETFKIIYELVAKAKDLLAELLPPIIERTDLGTLSVLAIFKNGKREMIVGGRILDGKMIKGNLIEVKRDGEVIGKGKLANLQHNKENAAEVGKGNECGITFAGDTKLAVTDTLVCYKEEIKKRTL